MASAALVLFIIFATWSVQPVKMAIINSVPQVMTVNISLMKIGSIPASDVMTTVHVKVKSTDGDDSLAVLLQVVRTDALQY